MREYNIGKERRKQGGVNNYVMYPVIVVLYPFYTLFTQVK